MKRNKGITLVALVITIIILIILAGITMSLVLGEGGLINRTQQGAAMYEDQSIREKIQLAAITASANTEARFDKDVFRTQLNEYFGEGNYTLTINDETGEITVTVKGKVYTLNANGSMQDGTGSATSSYDPANDPTLGSDTSDTTWDPDKQATGQAKLDLGETVNLRLKKIAALANGVSEDVLDTWTVYNSVDTYITSIEWTGNEPSADKKGKYGQLAMTADSALGMDADGTTNELIVSEVPIWAWYENGKIWIWSPDSTIDMHPHSERMFQGMTNLQVFGLYWSDGNIAKHLIPDNVTTMRCMFKDTKAYSQYNPIYSNWNVSNVKTSLKAGQENLPGNNGFYQMFCTSNVPKGYSRQYTPQFTSRAGTWDSEGTYFPTVNTCIAYDPADEVSYRGENFYIINYTASTDNNIRLMTKYPINLQGTAQLQPDPDSGTIAATDYRGKFSSEYYWESVWDEFYNPDNYTAEEWDSEYNQPVGDYLDINDVEGYVEGDAIYKVKNYGRTKNASDARLLTYNQYEKLDSFVRNKFSYNMWLGSAMCNNINHSYHPAKNLVHTNRTYQGEVYNYDNTVFSYGLYPVITVPRSEVTLVEQNTRG